MNRVVPRRLHRAGGIAASLLLATTAVTGLLWAYAPHLYWKAGYLEKKRAVSAPPLRSASLTAQQAAAIGGRHRPAVCRRSARNR